MTQTTTRPRDDSGLSRSGASEATLYGRYKAVIERIGRFDSRRRAINLLGIRGYRDGRPVSNSPDRYNDTIAVIWRDAAGRKRVREFLASVDPGQYWTDNPMRSAGCAHLVDGQYRYKTGLHKGRPGLVQAGPVTIWRDGDRDHEQGAGETVETGYFGINIHDAGTGSRVGKWSAGCQVVHGGRTGTAWQELLELADDHPTDTIYYTLVDRAVLGHSYSDGALTAPPATEPAPGRSSSRPLLRVGSTGTEVRELQRRLADLDHPPGSVDGIFGRKTERAVIAFQRAERLQADGIVGPQTWTALLGNDKALPDGATGQRRALLVALNDYGNPRNNLPSCVADARAFQAHLERVGYRQDDIRVITDEDATLTAVEDGLAWLFDGLTENDRAVFYYSGHGHQLPIDGVLTEVLVLRDGFYIDDVLAERSQQLPDGVFTAVLDSCFSGGMDKIVFGSVDGTADFAAPKRWAIDATSPPEANPDANQRSAGNEPIEITGYRRFGASKSTADELSDTPLKGLVLAACSENETASASTARTRGLSAFTYALLEAIDEHGPDATASRLLGSVRSTLADHGFRQTPTIHEPPGPFRLAERTFLALRDVTARPTAGDHETNRREGDVWTRLLARLQNLMKETDMTNELLDDETTEKALPVLAALAPLLIQGATAALGNAGKRRRRKKDFDVVDDDDQDDWLSSLQIAGVGDDDDDAYDPDGDADFGDGDGDEIDDEVAQKAFGLLASMAPHIVDVVKPAATNALSNLLGGGSSRRGGKRRNGRRRRNGRSKGLPNEAESNAKAFRLALRMITPIIRGSVKIRAR